MRMKGWTFYTYSHCCTANGLQRQQLPVIQADVTRNGVCVCGRRVADRFLQAFSSPHWRGKQLLPPRLRSNKYVRQEC